MTDVDLALILFAALAATGSPGPATLANAGASMGGGRGRGLALAAEVTSGSLIWSVAAALGLGALMLAHGWVFEIMRYAGAAYLAWLAWRSARAAFSAEPALAAPGVPSTHRGAYLRGLALHLTNPKSILFFGALYAVGVPHGATLAELGLVIAAVGLQSALVFHGYALVFSSAAMTAAYARLRRWFDGAAAAFFAVASLKILTARLS